MVKNFNNGKIYKIEYIHSNDDEAIYIGSTTKKYLSQRMTAHRAAYKRYNKTSVGFMSSFIMFNKYGVNNCKISLLENVISSNSDELKIHECKYIKLLNCVNIQYNEEKHNNDVFIQFNKVKHIQYNKDEHAQQTKENVLIQLFHNNNITNTKIKLIKELENEANILRFQIIHKDNDELINISDELYNKIKIVFRSVENKPLTYNKFIVYYVAKLNNIIRNINIINKNYDQIDNKRMTRYYINEQNLYNYIKNNLTNENKNYFDMSLINKFNILKPLFYN